ncbi:hypothetical protein JNUCC64_18165 [Streptomyces sp. JNUCC 64]
MIRLVRAVRLRALVEDATRSGREVARAQDEVRELRGRLDEAENDTEIARGDLLEVTRELEAAGARVVDLEEALRAARRAPVAPGMVVVLLRWGAVHSVHASVHDAEASAVAHGADPSGWGPPSSLPASQVAWRAVPMPVLGPEGGAG